MYGYRLTTVPMSQQGSYHFQIVTAISEGATEGKACHVVAQMDSQELAQLCPPTAQQKIDQYGSEEALQRTPLQQ